MCEKMHIKQWWCGIKLTKRLRLSLRFVIIALYTDIIVVFVLFVSDAIIDENLLYALSA